MIVTLQTQGLPTLEQVRAFLEGAASVKFVAQDRKAAYGFIAQALTRFRYFHPGKAEKGLTVRPDWDRDARPPASPASI